MKYDMSSPTLSNLNMSNPNKHIMSNPKKCVTIATIVMKYHQPTTAEEFKT